MDDSDRNCKRHHSKKFWIEKDLPNEVRVKICQVCNRVWGGNPDMGLVRIRVS